MTKDDGESVAYYSYDAENRFTAYEKGSDAVYYRYDAAGRRVKREADGTVQKWAFDRLDAVAEYDGSDALQWQHVLAGLDQILERVADSSVYEYLADHLGSTRTIIDANEATANAYDHSAFGEAHGTPTEDIANSFCFTGREWDSPTALYYYRARIMDPALGRFLERDPLAMQPHGSHYPYADARPVLAVDPMGMQVAIDEGYIGPDPSLGPVLIGGPGFTYQPSTGLMTTHYPMSLWLYWWRFGVPLECTNAWQRKNVRIKFKGFEDNQEAVLQAALDQACQSIAQADCIATYYFDRVAAFYRQQMGHLPVYLQRFVEQKQRRDATRRLMSMASGCEGETEVACLSTSHVLYSLCGGRSETVAFQWTPLGFPVQKIYICPELWDRQPGTWLDATMVRELARLYGNIASDTYASDMEQIVECLAGQFSSGRYRDVPVWHLLSRQYLGLHFSW